MGYGTSLGTSHEDEMSYHLERVASNSLTEKQVSDAQEISDNSKSGDFQSRFYATDQSTMPLEASRKLTDALKLQGVGGSTGEPFETKLTPAEETSFGAWKAQNAPKDSGADYDLRGAFKAGLQPDPETGHWPDTFKKPNHPTFSDQSMYAKDAPDKAGTWDGDRYIPPAVRSTIAEDLFGKGENDIRPALGHFYETVKNAFKLPGDVYSGKVPAGSVQEIERATDLAALMITGPAPVAAKVADGSLGSFMGVKSKTINKENLYKAQASELEKAHPDTIWEESRTFRGADGRWRQEIPDVNAKLRHENMDVVQPKQIDIDSSVPRGWQVVEGKNAPQPTVGIRSTVKKMPAEKDYIGMPENPTLKDYETFYKSLNEKYKPTILKDVLDHPDLYAAYPDVGNTKLFNLKDYKSMGLNLQNVEGVHVHGEGIYMRDTTPENFKSVLLHEAQHWIQEHEGFARGGNPSMFKPDALIPAEQNFIKVKGETLHNINKETGISHFELGWTLGTIKSNLERGVDPALTWGKQTEGMFNKLRESGNLEKVINIAKAQKLLDDAAKDWFNKYQRLSGEVESRNVQARMNFNDFGRSVSPRVDEEALVPRDQQIFSPEIKSWVDKSPSSAEVIKPVSPRWPNNDNMRPRNEHERYIEAYDKIAAWRESLPKNEYGSTKWTDLTTQKHKNMLKDLDKVWDNP